MGSMASGKDWDRLAEFVRERRVELGLTQEDARAAGGPSTATMRLIEGALQHSYQPATLRDLENVLRWGRGSVSRILGGGDPVLFGDAAGAADALAVVRTPLPPAPPSPRRELPGTVSNAELEPWRQQVLREIYTATGLISRFGPGELPEPSEIAGAEEILPEIDGAVIFSVRHEADAWDNPRLPLWRKIDSIARTRWLWARADEEERRRTGTGLAAGNFPRIRVAGTAAQASH